MTIKRLTIAGLALALAPCAAWADGVSRTVEPIAGGCRVTLAWSFTGHIESDLIIEERLAAGWTVDASTVPLDSLDASWFSGSVARFAVKPTALATAGSIAFTVVAGEGAGTGTVNGDWKLYMDDALRKGGVTGDGTLATIAAAEDGANGTGGTASGQEGATVTETKVAIAAFKLTSGGGCELSYADLAKAGTLVVEGCEALGGAWRELKRTVVADAGGTVVLETDEVGACRFMRMKLVTEE
ncbi:MAG: hypothetical protein ACI4R9_04590 [Kiritimatiellia bacterium]